MQPNQGFEPGTVSKRAQNSATIVLLASMALVMLALPFSASATLGEISISTEADRASMKASLGMSTTAKYTMHEIQAPSGTIVREYISPSGTVFAVAWQGPLMPDLRQTHWGAISIGTPRPPAQNLPVSGIWRFVNPTSLCNLTGTCGHFPEELTFHRCCRKVLASRKYDETGKGAIVRDVATVASFGILVLITGCGGGGGNVTLSTAPNVQAITVDPGPTNNINLLFTTVTICAPGNPSNCQSIDHVLVDTGSTGLRIMSSLLSPSLSLQQTGANGNPLAECGHFADGFTWGPVKLADVNIAGEQAGSVPIQVIGDPAFSAVPASCSSIGRAKNSVQTFGANGVLGVGVFQQDCGIACAMSAIQGTYFICPSTGCQATQTSLMQQLQNPVGMFALDNNGVIIALPSVPVSGAVGVSGFMIFGIGTQGNNALGSAQIIPVNPTTGNFTTILNLVTYSNGFVDSGSNALFFADANIPTCTTSTAFGFDCPLFPQNLTATNQGVGGATSIVNFEVANADSLFAANPNTFAFNNLAGPNSSATSFDWGLPFFFGRNVFTAIEGRNTPAGIGPYIAY